MSCSHSYTRPQPWAARSTSDVLSSARSSSMRCGTRWRQPSRTWSFAAHHLEPWDIRAPTCSLEPPTFWRARPAVRNQARRQQPTSDGIPHDVAAKLRPSMPSIAGLWEGKRVEDVREADGEPDPRIDLHESQEHFSIDSARAIGV